MYRRIYSYLRGQIGAGVFAVGDELPSINDLYRQFISLDRETHTNSCLHAYRDLMNDGLVEAREGGYFVAATVPPAPETTEQVIGRLDSLEMSLTETLVALRQLRGQVAGVQTPRLGQWWSLRSLALGADPAETSHAVLIRDRESGEPHWLVCVSNTWVKKPLGYFEPLRHLNYIEEWTCERDETDDEPSHAGSASARHRAADVPAAGVGYAYYATNETQAAEGDYD